MYSMRLKWALTVFLPQAGFVIAAILPTIIISLQQIAYKNNRSRPVRKHRAQIVFQSVRASNTYMYTQSGALAEWCLPRE